MRITRKQLLWSAALAIVLGSINLDQTEILALAVVGGLVISLTVREEEE